MSDQARIRIENLYRKLLTELSKTKGAKNYIANSRGDYEWVQEKLGMMMIEDFNYIWDEIIKPLVVKPA